MRITHSWTDETASISIEGLQETVRVLHVTDSHIALIDERDPEHIEKCEGSRERFGERRKDAEGNNVYTETSFDEAIAYAKDEAVDLVALTGDIIHFPSQASIDHVVASMEEAGTKTVYTAGNHDWHFPGLEGRDDLRQEWWPALEPLHGGNAACCAEEIGGILFVAVDDSTYQVNEEQLEFTRQQLARELPTVLLVHIPLSIATLRDPVIEKWKAPILIGDPVWEFGSRDRWGTDFDKPGTQEFVRLCSKANNLAAVFCGHVHFPHADSLSPRCVQYVGKPSYEGGWRMVEFRPL